MAHNSWPAPVRAQKPGDSWPKTAHNADLHAYLSARDHLTTTMHAWISWWGPIRKNVLSSYQEMDEANRTLIDALESLWRMGPARPNETLP